ncbi:MAG: AAA family ATPase [Cyanobacteria bacterium SZAS LIN-3]|nr:AAA family ATPase [Cyanobacteria bacterium SZAS LIN-3]
MTRKTKKLIIWILLIPVIGFLASRFVTPGEISTPPSHPYVRGGHVPATAPTAPISPATGTPNGVQPGAPPAAPAHYGRGGSAVSSPSVSMYELIQLMDAQPTTIRGLSFTNGSNDVRVSRVGGADFVVQAPDDGGKQELRARALADKIPFAVKEVKVDPIAKFMTDNALTLLIFGAFIGLMVMAQRRQAKQMKGITGMGSARAKDADAVRKSIKPTKFTDVAGCPEAVKELKRVVKGVVGKEVYDLFEAEMPKGILLIGPPGTGKTLLAKAVAGESDGTFSITSGSSFVEMLVGVGASRVRDLFENARKKVAETKKPHIIFIDEIDAVGGKRGGGTSAGSNSEREQTLNQILVEMDGMIGNEGILVIAATNRVDMLDDALLRPGRFDCHVAVDLPDKAGREEIFKIHLGKRPLGEGVTLAALAHRTYGYSGAEIKGVCNRAAIVAAEAYDELRAELIASGKTAAEVKEILRPVITLEHFDEAVDFVRYGNAAESKQARMSVLDKKNTAVHEGGHACSAAVLDGCDPVVKITIMRRSRALGYVQYLPENDRVSFTRDQALARIISMMAGRAAQEVILGTCDTGASNDFQQATDMARKMVVSWGMSRLGHISVGDRQDAMGTSGGPNQIGPDLANEIDREWRSITRACYKAAKDIVKADRERLEALVEILMDKETVLADEWQALLAKYPSKFDVKTLVLPKAETEEEGA